MGKFIDLTNMQFTRLKVIKRIANKNKKVMWLCECSCGNKVEVSGSNLKNGRVKSCGCLRGNNYSKIIDNYIKENGYSISKADKDRLYSIWSSLKVRCYNPNVDIYKYYGGIGVEMCTEWKESFSNFAIWAISNGYKSGLYVQRLNKKGNYSPENCSWITKEEQMNLKRQLYKVGDVEDTIGNLCRLYNIQYNVVNGRLHRGWTLERALTTKVRHKKCKSTVR